MITELSNIGREMEGEQKLVLFMGTDVPMNLRHQIRNKAIKADHLSQYGFSRCLNRIKTALIHNK